MHNDLCQRKREVEKSLQAAAELKAALATNICNAIYQLEGATTTSHVQLRTFLAAEAQQLVRAEEALSRLSIAKLRLDSLSATWKAPHVSR
jgi:hypothetical protein